MKRHSLFKVGAVGIGAPRARPKSFDDGLFVSHRQLGDICFERAIAVNSTLGRLALPIGNHLFAADGIAALCDLGEVGRKRGDDLIDFAIGKLLSEHVVPVEDFGAFFFGRSLGARKCGHHYGDEIDRGVEFRESHRGLYYLNFEAWDGTKDRLT